MEPEAGTSASETEAPVPANRVTPSGARITSGEIPEDFPKDIPVPPDSEPHMSMFFPGQGGMATFISNTSREDLRDYFSEGLADEGWNVDEPSEQNERTVIKAKKGARTANVVIATGAKGSEVMISVKGG